MNPEVWTGLYRQEFDLANAESNAHPAKMSWGLVFRIIERLEELGLLRPGDTVLDPMGGTGRTALAACSKGYRAITCELESRFVDMCMTYLCPGIPHVTITETTLPAVEAGWKERHTGGGDGLETKRYFQKALPERKRYKVVSQCRCGKSDWHPVHRVIGNRDYAATRLHRELDWTILQGDARHLADLLKEKGLVAVTSPPYGLGEGVGHAGETDRPILTERNVTVPYGVTPGQIGNLKVVTSPPYENTLNDGHTNTRTDGSNFGYNDGARDNIGNETGEDYASAMRLVYAQIGLVADTLAVVTKNPTRNKKIYPLDELTERLLVETGWTILCKHKAILFEEQTRTDLFGEETTKLRGRVSFFKRLAWQKGSPCADHEDIIIATRNGGGRIVTVTSPPYADAQAHPSLGSVNKDEWGHAGEDIVKHRGLDAAYGISDGQIGNLKLVSPSPTNPESKRGERG
jgi:hypothetical protein